MGLTKATNRMISGASVNVLDYGALGDGSTDDTVAIQAALNAGSSVEFPETSGAFLTTGNLQLSSNAHLFGAGTITRTDSAKDLFQAIGTQGTHVKNIRIEGLRFRDETEQSGGTSGYPAMLRLAYGDDVIIQGNNFFNMNVIRAGVTALHATTDEESAYSSITDTNMNQRISIVGNVGYCATPTATGSLGSYFAALTYTRDFVISDNVIDNYLDGIYINGGFLTATAVTDAVLKSHHGIVSHNTCNPVRVGMWTWSARDIMFDNNTIEGGTDESYDAEASANITFQNSTIKSSSGVVFSTFYNVRNMQILNNTVESDQAAGSAPLFNASLGDVDNGDLIFRGNTCIGTHTGVGSGVTMANLNPAFNRHLVIEDNTFVNVAIVGYSEMGMIDINNNKFVYEVTPPIEPIDLSGAILTAAAGVGYRRPSINIKYNSFVNNTNASINQTCIEVGHSTVACFYNFIGNDVQDFTTGVNIPVGVLASGVLHTIITKDNKFDVTGNHTLIQDSSDATVSHVFTNNTNGSGLGLLVSGLPPSNSYYSVGSTFYFTAPAAAGTRGAVCVTAGRPGTWKTFGAITA
jgi:hypothetical protein